MTDAAVRLATTDDLATLVLLHDLMSTEQVDARGGFIWEQTRSEHVSAEKRLASLLKMADAWVLLGSYDGVPLGFATLSLQQLRDGETIGVINDLFVESEAREVGLGEVLMTELLGLCRSHGCIGIDAAVLPGNRAAKNFMESNGLKARLIQVHKDLR